MNQHPHDYALSLGPCADYEFDLVEQGLAQTLGLELGDVLSFEIAGKRSEARITSLRKLDWDSMRVNFFVIAAPGMLESYPASYITSFYLPPAQMDFANRLVARPLSK